MTRYVQRHYYYTSLDFPLIFQLFFIARFTYTCFDIYTCFTACVQTVRKAAPTLLNHIEEPVHYVDLGGIKGHSLSQFGGSDTFWAGVKKLYASNCGLESIDGLKKLTNISYLYLDNNQLSDKELMRLCTEIPRGTLKGLDITGNPGLTEEVFGAFLDSGILKNCEFFNGERLRDTGFVG